MSGLSRNNLPKEAKAKAASESSFTSSYCVSVLQRGMNLFKKLLKTSGSPPPWRMWHVSGGAQGAEEALSRAACLSSAASELGEQNHCKCRVKAPRFHERCAPAGLSWHRGKACAAWLWISLKRREPPCSQKDASIHKELPSREVTQAASPQGGCEAGEASGRRDEQEGSGRAEDKH